VGCAGSGWTSASESDTGMKWESSGFVTIKDSTCWWLLKTENSVEKNSCAKQGPRYGVVLE